MDHAEVLDRLEAAFLTPGGLPALHVDGSDEATSLRAHLATCWECAVEHRAWEVAGFAMDANVPETLRAPSGARERTLAAVATTGVARAASAPMRPPTDLRLEASRQRAGMPPGHDLDHDPPILNALDGLVARVDPQLLADRLLDRDLSALSYSTWHGMNIAFRYVSVNTGADRRSAFASGGLASDQ